LEKALQRKRNSSGFYPRDVISSAAQDGELGKSILAIVVAAILIEKKYQEFAANELKAN
jgi:hypothetical protein